MKAIFFLLLLSCSLQRRSQLELTPKEIRDDREVLLYALNNSYAGNYFAPGINIKNIYKKLSKKSNKVSKEDFFLQIQKTFSELPDNSITVLKKPKSFPSTSKQWNLQEKDSTLLLTPYDLKKPSLQSWTLLEKKLKKAKALILDLRKVENFQSDLLGIKIARFINGGVLKHPVIRQHHIRTKESVRLLSNYYKYHFPKKDIPFPPYRKGEAKVLPIEFRRDKEAYSKKYAPELQTLVLVDKNCKKSCETTLLALEENPNVTLIGKKTVGEMHFSHEGLLMLPNSGFFIYIPTAYSELSDGRFLEKKGFSIQFPCQKSNLKWAHTFEKQLCGNTL